jgi:hypothetical protein
MRTKTLLLSAAALLSAGFISTQAQVYSQNVVGYANVSTPAGPNYMITVPFAIGASNGANEIWPLISPGVPSLPDFSEILIWNPSTVSYTAYYSDSGSSTLWDDGSFNQNAPAPILPVGKGFFLIPSANVTNVFAGTIAVNVGTSNATAFATGPNYLVGCPVPYAGAVTNGDPTTFAGGPNLSINGGLPDYSEILLWNPATVSYTAYYSDSGSSTLWDDGSFNQNVALPTLNVGQAFFLIPSANFTWKVGL